MLIPPGMPLGPAGAEHRLTVVLRADRARHNRVVHALDSWVELLAEVASARCARRRWRMFNTLEHHRRRESNRGASGTDGANGFGGELSSWRTGGAQRAPVRRTSRPLVPLNLPGVLTQSDRARRPCATGSDGPRLEAGPCSEHLQVSMRPRCRELASRLQTSACRARGRCRRLAKGLLRACRPR